MKMVDVDYRKGQKADIYCWEVARYWIDDVRAEYSQMLRQQLSKGNNGLTKTKFLTYGIEGDSMAQVKPRLEHIQNDLMNNFHRLGVLAKPLDGSVHNETGERYCCR